MAWPPMKYMEEQHVFLEIFCKEMLLLKLKEIEIGQNLRKSSDFWRYGEWANRATNMHYLSRKGKRVLEGSSEVGKADTPSQVRSKGPYSQGLKSNGIHHPRFHTCLESFLLSHFPFWNENVYTVMCKPR